jgi:8-oxo-dGTP diphosphatase
VGVILIRGNSILLGERLGSHGKGTWAPPGGHLEYGETVEQCARRETLEETGLILDHVTLAPFTNDIFTEEDRHYVTLFVTSREPDGVAQVLEPKKCARWEWCMWSALPTPLFRPLETLRIGGFNPTY